MTQVTLISIKLEHGEVLLDADSAKIIADLKLYTYKGKNSNTAYCHFYDKNTQEYGFLHRRILGLIPSDNIIVDHIDGNGLNNQKENLRFCTKKQNSANRKKNKNNFLKYKGVTYDKRLKTKPFYAKIVINGKNKNLGNFATQEEAARRYNEEAIKIHGKFARLNEIDND